MHPLRQADRLPNHTVEYKRQRRATLLYMPAL